MLSSLAPQRLAFKFFYPTLGSGGCRKFIANGSYLNLTIPLCYGYARLWCHLENELRSPPARLFEPYRIQCCPSNMQRLLPKNSILTHEGELSSELGGRNGSNSG